MEPRKLRISSALLALLLAVLLPVQARAAIGPIDTGKDASLTIRYEIGKNIPAPGVRFDLYRVADMSGDMEFTLAGEFAQYAGYVSLEARDTEAWEALATTLEGLVLRDRLMPLAAGYTDSKGFLAFSPLETGLYLVLGGQYVVGSKTYTAVPALVALPESDETGTEWLYDVTAEPKNTAYDNGGSPDDTVSRKVWKRWDDAGYEKSRPAYVTVQLLDRSGRVWRTSRLSESNKWQEIWRGLPAGVQWTVVEEPVPGYTVSVRQAGATFVVTNTSETGGHSGPDTPDDPDDPDAPDAPDRPDKPGDPDHPGSSDPPKLPQTGVLWWPVPVLLAAGLMLIIVGFVRRREDDAE